MKLTFKKEVKKGEESYIHAILQKKGIDQETEKALFIPQLYIADEAGFLNFLKNRQGLKIIEIFHMPKGFKIPKPKA